MGADWRDAQIRYLVHFDDGGSGMRHQEKPLAVGAEFADGVAVTASSASSRRRTRTRSGTRG